MDSPRTQLAFRLNSASKDLAKIRFSLVPSRLKEPVFWDATLYLVKERLKKYNDSCKNGGAMPENVPLAETRVPPTNGAVSKQQQVSTTPKMPPNGNGKSIHKLEEELAKKDAEIAELKKKLEDVEETLLDVAKLPSSHPTSAPMNGASKKCNHKGQWKINKDSEEFLAYPEDVKEAMRTEKQKRLRQVREEMQFILDSDNIEDSQGQWDCCGGTEYDADCARASI
mmetsp:Transcript_27621/g.67183  ORF Transcript_27621/g.67183 Transcript_27621/m.67183 type:complete len:226 (-) Transcript_27621:49-726(-)